MGFLGVLHLAGVLTWRIRHELCAVELLGLSAGGLDACVGQSRGVRTHISNVAVFIQTLRNAHGALRGKAQLAASFLLQRRGHKRWVRAARVRLLLYPGDLHAGADQTVSQVLGALLVQHDRRADQLAGIREIATLRDLFTVDGGQLRRELVRLSIRRIHLRSQIPIFGGDECHALALALHDHAGGHRLHASGGQARHDLLPQHRRDLIAIQAVQHAARFLRIHQVLVQLAGILCRGEDGGLGDLMENHAAHGNLRLEHLEQVPGDCLAFAVGVCS